MSGDVPLWFDASPLERDRSVVRRLGALKPGGKEGKGTGDGDDVIRAFAAANGLDYRAAVGLDVPDAPQLPGLHFVHRCKDVVATRTEPYVELGNLGPKLMIGDNFEPHRGGYIAVRHGLPLPHVYLDAGKFGALSPKNVVAAAITVASFFDESAGGDDDSPLGKFRKAAPRLDLGRGKLNFTARCPKDEADRARALLTGEPLAIANDIATSFDLELCDSWLFAYNNYGEVSTTHADVWAWVFSTASRMIDLMHALAELMPPGTTVAAPGRDLPIYTTRHVERPSRVEGSLKFLKRSR